MLNKMDEHTALYSLLDIEYAQEMGGDYEDLSFRSDECTIIAALKDDKVTGYWRPVVAFGKDSLLKSHIQRIYDTCSNICFQDFLIDGNLSAVGKFLLEKGGVATPYYTQIIDLTKTEKELHSDLRKSYKSLVNKRHIISDLCLIKPLQNLHEQVKGETRSDESWFIQQKMMWKKEAFALLQSRFMNLRNPSIDNTINEAGVLFYYNKHTAYYASGCSLEGVNSHAIIWRAILKCKKLGCKTLEMGEQNFGEGKLSAISKFKRGFGGCTKVRMNICTT